MVMRKRLIDQNAQPFLYQAIGDYQVEAAKSTLGRKFRIGDLSHYRLATVRRVAVAAGRQPEPESGLSARGSGFSRECRG